MYHFLGLILVFSPSNALNLCSEPLFRFRIVGGEPVESGANWMAKLVSYGDDREGILCGATVVDDHWLLTAAHCALQLKSKSYVTVRKPSSERELTFSVKQAFVHPKYNNRTADNDIALLKIGSDLSKRGIKPVCLVKDDSSLLKTYKDGLVIGYGLVLDVSSGVTVLQNSQELRNATIPIIPDSECSKTWRILSFRSVDITSNQICAGSYMHGTAPGDSGGPLLIHKSNGEYVQIGITSFGADGLDGLVDQGKFPGVYTRVSKYVPWMQRVIANCSKSFSSSLLLLIFVVLSRPFWWL